LEQRLESWLGVLPELFILGTDRRKHRDVYTWKPATRRHNRSDEIHIFSSFLRREHTGVDLYLELLLGRSRLRPSHPSTVRPRVEFGHPETIGPEQRFGGALRGAPERSS